MTNNLKNKLILANIFVLFILVVPLFAFGQATQDPVPPPGTALYDICAKSLPGGGIDRECTFNDLITLAKNFINFLIYIAIPLAALSFAWAGFKIMTAAGEESKVTEGKEIFTKVAYGLMFVLAGWLIIHTILIALLKPGSDLNLLG